MKKLVFYLLKKYRRNVMAMAVLIVFAIVGVRSVNQEYNGQQTAAKIDQNTTQNLPTTSETKGVTTKNTLRSADPATDEEQPGTPENESATIAFEEQPTAGTFSEDLQEAPAFSIHSVSARLDHSSSCSVENVNLVNTTVLYHANDEEHPGAQLSYTLDLVAEGMSLDGYSTHQAFTGVIEPGKDFSTEPNEFGFTYPHITDNASLSLQLTTLSPDVASTIITVPLTNECAAPTEVSTLEL